MENAYIFSCNNKLHTKQFTRKHSKAEKIVFFFQSAATKRI